VLLLKSFVQIKYFSGLVSYWEFKKQVPGPLRIGTHVQEQRDKLKMTALKNEWFVFVQIKLFRVESFWGFREMHAWSPKYHIYSIKGLPRLFRAKILKSTTLE